MKQQRAFAGDAEFPKSFALAVKLQDVATPDRKNVVVENDLANGGGALLAKDDLDAARLGARIEVVGRFA